MFLIRNFLINSSIFSLTLFTFKYSIKANFYRIIIASATADIITTVIILTSNSIWIYSLVSLFVVLPGGVCFLMRKKYVLKEFFITLVITFLLGGIINAIDGIMINEINNAFGAEIVFAVIIGYFSLLSLQKRMRKGRDLYVVSIFNEGRCFVTQGKFDSGNVLRDAASKKPVHIASPKIFEILGKDADFIEVGYKSLGNDAGVLQTCFFDEMIVNCNGRKYVIEKPLIGKASDELLKSLAYDIILNEAVFDDSNVD